MTYKQTHYFFSILICSATLKGLMSLGYKKEERDKILVAITKALLPLADEEPERLVELYDKLKSEK